MDMLGKQLQRGTLVRLPDGIEASLRIYLYSPSTDLEVTFDVKGLTSFPTTPIDPVDATKLLPHINVPDCPTDWRVMTREEIADYRRREREED